MRKSRRRRKPRRWKKPSQGNVCRHCGRSIRIMPYICRYCGGSFCPDHRLPENHDCERLKRISHVPPKRRKGIKVPRPRIPRLRMPRRGRKLFPMLGLIFLIFAVEWRFAEHLVFPTYYLLAGITPCWITYKLFIRASRIRAHSDMGIFGLKLLAGLAVLVGLFMIMFPMMWPLLYFLLMPLQALTTLSTLSIDPLFIGLEIFMVVQGFGLMLLGGFIYFKYMRRAGIIIFPR